MVPSGFRRCGNLSFINQFSKKYYQLASTASNIKGCQYSTWYFMILTKNICFQKIKIKLNPGTWMTLQSSVVIFQALEPLQPQWPLQPQQPQWPQWPQQPHFIKIITETDGAIIPSTQMIKNSPFLWNGSSKIQFFTNIWFPFFRRLLRPADGTFLKTGWWNTNFPTSRSH